MSQMHQHRIHPVYIPIASHVIVAPLAKFGLHTIFVFATDFSQCPEEPPCTTVLEMEVHDAFMIFDKAIGKTNVVPLPLTHPVPPCLIPESIVSISALRIFNCKTCIIKSCNKYTVFTNV